MKPLGLAGVARQVDGAVGRLRSPLGRVCQPSPVRPPSQEAEGLVLHFPRRKGLWSWSPRPFFPLEVRGASTSPHGHPFLLPCGGGCKRG